MGCLTEKLHVPRLDLPPKAKERPFLFGLMASELELLGPSGVSAVASADWGCST